MTVPTTSSPSATTGFCTAPPTARIPEWGGLRIAENSVTPYIPRFDTEKLPPSSSFCWILPARAWQVASCGPGSKGERRYAWAWLATASDRHFLLIRRSLSKPTELAYFYCYVPEHTPATLGVLVAVTGRRWTIEEDHEFGKDQFGFDQSQVRLYTPIMRHIVLVMAALAICAVATADARTRAEPQLTPSHPTAPPPADLGLIPLTVVEIKRLFNLATRICRSASHYLHWSSWRRRHQARARWYHHRARLT